MMCMPRFRWMVADLLRERSITLMIVAQSVAFIILTYACLYIGVIRWVDTLPDPVAPSAGDVATTVSR